VDITLRRLVSSLIFAFALLGCSFSEPKLGFPGLSNRGVIPLSTTNAYVGSNSFLGLEMEKSPNLFHFIENRGAPHAVRIMERKNRSPELILFYPNEASLYIGELNDSRSNYNWIIRGPQKISRSDSHLVSSDNLDLVGSPVVSVFNKIERFASRTPRTIVKTVPVVNLPTVKPTPSNKAKPIIKSPKPGANKKPSSIITKKEAPTEFKPLNTDQMAILMSQGFAERDRNGDVMHTVQSDSEKIDDIAKWYTLDAKNSQAILKATGMEGAQALIKGFRVRIPLALVKNAKQMQNK